MSSVMSLPPMHHNVEMELVLYAPDNRHMARLGAVLAGKAKLRWLDSREISPQKLLDNSAEASLMLLDYCGVNANYSSELARQLTVLGSALPMIGVGMAGAEQATHLLAAVRAGVRDFIDVDNNAAQILEVFQRVISQSVPSKVAAAAAPVAAPSGRLIVLLGVRAGMGTTTLAAHLATQLAIRMSSDDEPPARNSKVLLLDMGQPSGDAALYLGIDSGLGYEEALRSVDRIDTTFAGTAFAHHGSQLALLGVTSGTLLPPHEPAALLARLRSVFSLTLCDTGGLPIQHIPLALLKQASEIWLVTDQAIGSLVSIHQTLRELEQRGLRGQELHLLVNRYDPSIGISDEQIAQRFELPLLTTLPERSKSLRSSIGLGHLLTESAPRDPYVRALAPLLQRLDRRQSATAASSSITRLANLLGRESWKKN